MGESGLNEFRKKWKKDIEEKCQQVLNTKEQEHIIKVKGTQDLVSGKADDGIINKKKHCNTAKTYDNSSEQYKSFDLSGDKRQYNTTKPSKDDTLSQAKKKKGSTTAALLTLDIPSYYHKGDHKYLKNDADIATVSNKFTDDTLVEDENQDLTSVLIRDIDEITAVPFFDISLPKEVCVKIFAYLDVKDLCCCAIVSKAWSVLASDDLIWFHIYRKLGFKLLSNETALLDRTHWKNLVKENILQQRLVERNWKEMICHTENLEYEKGVAVSACNMHGNVVAAGYANGKTCLWDINSNWRQFLEPSAEVITDPSKSSVEHVTAIDNMCATAFMCGLVNVWHTDISMQPLYQFQLASPASSVVLAKSGRTNDSPTLLTTCGVDVRIDQIMEDGQWGMVKTRTFEDKIVAVNLLYSEDDAIFAIALKEDILIFIPKTDSILNLDKIAGTKITAINSSDHHIAVGWAPYGFGIGSEFTTKARLYDKNTLKHTQTFLGHYGEITYLNLSYHQWLVTGSKDKKVRIYDLRTERPQMCLRGQTSSITTVQMDSWKVVSGAYNGTVKVWDIRMGNVLWETSGHHPVRLCQFNADKLVIANIPLEKVPRESMWYTDDLILHRRHRGSVKLLDFSCSSESVAVPEEMKSNYDDTAGYNYNINLVAPYDDLTSEIN